jgi:imidazolonepropionase-like amidohydrolase
VLLSLNFPRRTTAASADADPEPLRILRARVEAPKGAGRLAAARVKFAFQSDGLTSMDDFRGNAGKAVENGLSTDEAIKAMTLSAAEILNVADRLGSLEIGKIANLTVVRGNLLDRSTRIAYLFIDGRQIDLRPAGPGQAPQASPTPTETAPPVSWHRLQSVTRSKKNTD